ncbi:MAG: site-2 protease family protein [Acidobacteriota bacterium]|nr:site-2 protease family protein [Acidobacteriota bacterium]MDE3171098.1 site-2 protease family protein [Acidobacteriota bacterium]
MPQPQRGPGVQIGHIFGIPIYLHPSWLIIFALITVTIGLQFTAQHPHWSPAEHWVLGIITSLLFFASVLFHELCHSVVALRYKLPVKSITLFVFGGLSAIEREPSSAGQEFKIAVAGPVSSLFLAGVFWAIWQYARPGDAIAAMCSWLAYINLVLGLFNLVPGFPLDGGRVLRGIIWGITKDYRKASQIASASGRFFAYLMILGGIWLVLRGNWIAGLWTAFIGWFLLEAAKETYVQVALRETLAGVRTDDVMLREIPTVPRDMSIEEYIHQVLRTGRRTHIVVGGDHPSGLISLQSARHVPREEWVSTSVQAVMVPMAKVQAAKPDEPVLDVLQRMQTSDINQMPVVSDGHVVGMIGRDIILQVLQTRLHTEQHA